MVYFLSSLFLFSPPSFPPSLPGYYPKERNRRRRRGRREEEVGGGGPPLKPNLFSQQFFLSFP